MLLCHVNIFQNAAEILAKNFNKNNA